MDREKYWNEVYPKYWKQCTEEAENSKSERTSIKKLSGNDYKVASVSQVESFLEQIKYDMEGAILDYGCGQGRFFNYLAKKGRYYGIDISHVVIDECKRQYPEDAEYFIVSPGEQLPFDNCFFSVIVCYAVFDTCYQEKALSEMLRVLKPGGYVFFSGKNIHYHKDDQEALIAEINARKKGHPNSFTDYKCMKKQAEDTVDFIEERFIVRRGDDSKNIYESKMPEVFYQWMAIVKKKENSSAVINFEKFSYDYSQTYNDVYGN